MYNFKKLSEFFPVMRDDRALTESRTKPKVIKYQVFKLGKVKLVLVLMNYYCKDYDLGSHWYYLINTFRDYERDFGVTTDDPDIIKKREGFEEQGIVEALIRFKNIEGELINKGYKTIEI